MKQTIRIGALSLLLAVAAVPSVLAGEEMPVPPKLQAALFQKIFGYDKAIGSAAAARIGVVFADAAPGVRDEVVKTFTEAGLAVTPVKLSALPGGAGNVNVLYVLPGAGSPVIAQAAKAGKLLVISGVPSFAESGVAGIALETVSDKPKIVVNLAAVKAAEHSLAPDLLKLSRVVQ